MRGKDKRGHRRRGQPPGVSGNEAPTSLLPAAGWGPGARKEGEARSAEHQSASVASEQRQALLGPIQLPVPDSPPGGQNVPLWVLLRTALQFFSGCTVCASTPQPRAGAFFNSDGPGSRQWHRGESALRTE